MRRLIFATTLLLAGCATTPQQTAAPTPPPQPVVPVERQSTQLAGLSASELTSHLGRPALQIREGTSSSLNFAAASAFSTLTSTLDPMARSE